MAKVLWSILCEKAVIDQISKTVSLHSLLEKVEISPDIRNIIEEGTKTPAIPIRFDLVTLFSRSNIEQPETAIVRLAVKKPNTKKKAHQEETIDLVSAGKGRLIIGFPAITYTGEGDYIFYIEQKHTDKSDNIKWKKMSETSIELAITNPDKKTKLNT